MQGGQKETEKRNESGHYHADVHREDALPSRHTAEEDIGTGEAGGARLQQAVDRRRAGGVYPELGAGSLHGRHTGGAEAQKKHTNIARVDGARALLDEI